MKAFRFTVVLIAGCASMCAQSQTTSQKATQEVAKPAGSVAKTAPTAKTGAAAAAKTKEGDLIDRCDRQFRKVCVITLSHLRRENLPPHNPHAYFRVHKNHAVVWIADLKEKFQFGKFQRVDCDDESKLINEPNDPGPFDNSYEKDTYENVKYAIVTGPVHACYKHSIEVDPGNGKPKEHIDPHIMVDVPDSTP